MSDEPFQPLRIIGLRAEHIMRLQAVEITPDPNMVIIGGANGAGKSSLLESIVLALRGKRAQADIPEPIHHGESSAQVVVDLGELVVTRKFNASGTQSLVVRARDGSRINSAQAVLDALTGEMAFDPLMFASQHPKVQRNTLLGLIPGMDDELAVLDVLRQQAYDDRTDRNRYLKTVEARIEEIPVIANPVTISVSDAVAAAGEAQRQQRENMNVRAAYHRAVTRSEDLAARRTDLERELAILAEQEADSADDFVRNTIAFEALRPDPDVVGLQAQVAAAEAAAQHSRDQVRRLDMESEAEGLVADIERLNEVIAGVDQDKLDLLASAEMPVAGLSLNDNGLTYNGVAFSQASSSEQLRVSVAIAMAANPRIRVIRIAEGALLDDDSMAMLEAMAVEMDFQCFVEVVGTANPAAIIIEDGRVRE